MSTSLSNPYLYESTQVLSLLKTSPQGLSSEEAKRRLSEYGFNEIEEEKKIPYFKMLVSQFTNLLVVILIVSALISLYLGETIEAIAIIAIVLLAGILGFLQEYQAEKSLIALKKLIVPYTKVIRDGKVREIPVRELVPGDIVQLEAGDKVPADGRILQAVDLAVDEAILTGESYPVEKTSDKIEGIDLPPHQQKNMLFMGTSIVRGKATMVVTATGRKTEFGKIATLLQEVEEKKTPLQENLERASKQLGTYILLLAGAIGAVGVLKGYPLSEMFLWSVALAVAMIPEALPAVTTISLALGVKRMAEKKALVRKLSAVETLGSVTYICSDKTGTLTKNQMTVRKIFCNNREIEVTGVGYEPKGEFKSSGQISPLEDPQFHLLLLTAILCNNSELFYDHEEKAWKIKGDPTEGALIVLGAKVGLRREELLKEYPLELEIPFSSERMKMTTIHKIGNDYLICTKGALEKILESSNQILLNQTPRPLTEDLKEELFKKAREYYEQGLRVLAFAYKKVTVKPDPEEAEKDLLFLGFVGMIDPPREEVKQAIEDCFSAGIKPVMITGDHKITAMAVGKEIGLLKNGIVLTGQELRALSEREFTELVEKVEIYARAMPEDKLRIVKALQSRGHIVAMTGDGVNDAPALKQANIGIAMGKTGTEVAREASSMVLIEESFATIVKAIEEGRTIFSNIRKFIVYLMTDNSATVLALTIALLFNLPLPLTALQILFINLLMDGAPAIALGIESPEPGIMKRPPRSPQEGILNRESFLFIFFMGGYLCLLILGLYYYYLQHKPELANSVFFAGLITFRLFNAINCRSLTISVFKLGLFTNPWLILAISSSFLLMLLVIYTPLNIFFKVVPLGLEEWLIIFLLGFSILAVNEIRKFLLYRRKLVAK